MAHVHRWQRSININVHAHSTCPRILHNHGRLLRPTARWLSAEQASDYLLVLYNGISLYDTHSDLILKYTLAYLFANRSKYQSISRLTIVQFHERTLPSHLNPERQFPPHLSPHSHYVHQPSTAGPLPVLTENESSRPIASKLVYVIDIRESGLTLSRSDPLFGLDLFRPTPIRPLLAPPNNSRPPSLLYTRSSIASLLPTAVDRNWIIYGRGRRMSGE